MSGGGANSEAGAAGGAAAAAEAILHYRAMSKRYGDLVAVDRLTLEVRRGEMFGLIGPDGAGKTTALRVALGLLAADGGSVRTCGLDPRRQRRELAHRAPRPGHGWRRAPSALLGPW